MSGLLGAAVVPLLLPALAKGQRQLTDTVPAYEVIAYRCSAKPADRVQTGFVVEGIEGIVTALHGVVGCRVNATSSTGAFVGLTVTHVDVARDIAVLGSPDVTAALRAGAIRPQRRGATPAAESRVFVIGFPRAVPVAHQVDLGIENPGKRIQDLLSPGNPAYDLLARRLSPRPTTIIVSLTGLLQPGHSGAPVVDERGRVFAVGNGGISGTGFGWAIPLHAVELVPAGRAPELKRLARSPETQYLFAFTSAGIRPVALRPSTSISGLVGRGGQDWRVSYHVPMWLGVRRFSAVLAAGAIVNEFEQEIETLPGTAPSDHDWRSSTGYASGGLEFRPRPLPDRFWDAYARAGIGQLFASGFNPRLELALGIDVFASSRIRTFFEAGAVEMRVTRDEYTFDRFGAPEVADVKTWVTTYGVTLGVGIALGPGG